MTERDRLQSKFRIKDACRRNLNAFTTKAFRSLPAMDEPEILDLGCGTGVSTLCLLEICDGHFEAVDSDRDCVDWFQSKVDTLGHGSRVRVHCSSVFDLPTFDTQFDVVIAEGLLNVIGFARGLAIQIELLKRPGYIILHDELKNESEKRELFRENQLRLLTSFELDEHVWWDEYISCLEQAVASHDDNSLLKAERKEIELYKQDPSLFRSIFYVLKRS